MILDYQHYHHYLYIEGHMSFRDISRIIKSYERKLEIHAKQKKNQGNNNNNRDKEISLSTRACKLVLANKKPIQVKIELNVSSALAEKFWLQYLKLNKLNEFYEFYEIFQYDMAHLLNISGFIRRNNIQEVDEIANIKEC